VNNVCFVVWRDCGVFRFDMVVGRFCVDSSLHLAATSDEESKKSHDVRNDAGDCGRNARCMQCASAASFGRSASS
jgi:hypothetical protein